MLVKDYFLPLTTQWDEEHYKLPDYMRSMEFLGSLVARKDTVFVKLDNAWLIFIGDGDNISTVVLGEPEGKAARRIFKRALNATKSTRLTAFVPTSAQDYYSTLKKIGFKTEGRMKDSIIYNREPSDAFVMGFYANAKKGRKRKRRSRRAQETE